MGNVAGWIAGLHCPTREEMIDIAIASLPRGRAWQTDEGGPDRGNIGGFQRNAFQEDAFANSHREPSVLFQYWAAIGEFLTFAAQRFCALRLEFFCATETETNDLWMEEYGLPDECDPFPDLCSKVAAIGGTRCDYYAMIAARAGWSISCEDNANECGTRVGDRTSKAGRAKPGRVRRVNILTVFVNRHESPSYKYTTPRSFLPRAGKLKAGQRLSCYSDPTPKAILPLECLMARVVHAELKIEYKVA